MKQAIFLFCLIFCSSLPLFAQDSLETTQTKPAILYGTASFYANKFAGRKTASGEIFSQNKMTAACNILPLGTWIKVTNLRNKRSIIVKTNDRLHAKTRRLIDLTRLAAKNLGFIHSGIIRVKVDVLGKKKPENKVDIK